MATHSKTPGQNNATHPALGDKLKIHLLPMHIKLGLINILVKDVCKESKGSGLFKAKISQNKCHQEERKNFCWSPN